MVVRIRLARHGQKHTPIYHIVAINSTKRRDARPLEKLGEFDPIPRVPANYKLPTSTQIFGTEAPVLPKEKRIEWNVDRIKYWLGVGAQPTKTVVKLLEKGGVLTTPHKWQHQWSPPPPGGVAASASAPVAPAPAAAPASDAPAPSP